MKPNWKAAGAAILLSTVFGVGCGDTYRPVATPILQPGGDPNFFDVITSVNTNPLTDQPGSVTEINVSGDTNVANKPMGVGPTFGAMDVSRNLVFTVQPAQNNVTVTFLTAFVLTTITMPDGAQPSFITAGQNVMYTANKGAIETCSPPAQGSPTGSVSVLDAVQFSVQKDICVGSDPEFILQNGNARSVFVLDKASNQVWLIDQTTNTVFGPPVTVGSAPVWAVFSLDTNQVFVLNQGSNSISVLDALTGAVIGSPIPTGGTNSVKMVLDARLNRLYVINQGSNSVSVFDAGNLSALPRIVPVGAAPNSIAFNTDASRAWVANTGANTITEFNTANFQTRTLTVAPVGSTVTSVAASRNGDKVYASSVEPTNMKNGIAIVRTVDDSLVSPAPAYITIQPTQQDPNCNASTSQCPLQRPIQLLSR